MIKIVIADDDDIFRNGLKLIIEQDKDIHAKTASDIFGIKLEDVTKDMRRTAKAVNFGILYGILTYLCIVLILSFGLCYILINNINQYFKSL